jgi:hypothetical protein
MRILSSSESHGKSSLLWFDGVLVGHLTQESYQPLEPFAIAPVNCHLFGVVSPEFQKLLIRDSEGIVATILSLMSDLIR